MTFLAGHSFLFNNFLFQDLMQFDDKGNKTNIPDKERQIEALQLLFLILPPANRNLLKLLLDLLYQTAKKQDKNKMSAYNLALMFAPHVLWPKNVSIEGKIFRAWFSQAGPLLWLYVGEIIKDPRSSLHIYDVRSVGVIKAEGPGSCNLTDKSFSSNPA